MTTKRVKNNTATIRAWLGQEILPGTYYTLQHSEEDIWADDQDVYNSIEDGSLIIANSTEDILDLPSAHAFIQGTKRVSFVLASKPLGDSANATTYTTIANYLWLKNRGYNYENGTCIFDGILGDRTLDIRVMDVTNNVQLGILNVSTSGFYSFPIAKPTTDARLELQIKKNANGGTSPVVKASALEFDLV